jgi:3-hydroxyacyl-[acyl-carrier-protein] dehydratase
MLDHQQIKRINPQRHPIALLDRIVELVPGQRIVAIKAVTAAEPCYANVPEAAGADALAYPQSLMLESFCQAAGPLAFETGLDIANNTMLFVSMGEIEFLAPVLPGDVMEHHVCILRLFDGVVLLGGDVRVAGTVVTRVGQVMIAARAREAAAQEPVPA